MKLVDANVLIYAVDATAPHHDRAHRWLDGALNGSEETGLPWLCLLAFIRIMTKGSLFAHPLTLDQAFEVVQVWLNARSAVVVDAGPGQAATMHSLLRPLGSGGNLTSDAFLAALALTHNADVVTFDADFKRFPSVRVMLLA